MKTAAPTIIEIENEADVQTYRDATGEVLNVGETIVKGMINDSPTGIRRFPNMAAALDYFGKTMCVDSKPAPKPAKKSAKKAAKAVSTKKSAKPAKPKAKKSTKNKVK